MHDNLLDTTPTLDTSPTFQPTPAQAEVQALNADAEKSQAELQGLESTTGFAGYVGHPPVVKVEKSHQAIYEEMWGKEEYRQVAPGETCATMFMDVVRPREGAQVIDFGTGTGRGAVMLAALGGLKVKMLDFASNCLDDFVREALKTQPLLSFETCNLIKPIPHHAEYGYCTDVMEHIPPEWVTTVLVNILHSAQHVFFQISCEEDQCGKLIGEKLHLTVQPYAWWVERLQKCGARITWSRDFGTHCMIFCTAWDTGKKVQEQPFELTETMEQIRKNVEVNLQGPWTDIGPHQTNDTEVLILGGGPSLKDSKDEIRQLIGAGCKVVTLNGAGNWLREWMPNTPVNQFLVDAREFNKRFVEPISENNLYFCASQVHPSVLENLPKNRTFLFHVAVKSIEDLLHKHRGLYFDASGGSTVLLRAICVLTMMGFRKFHLIGCDSCLLPAEVEATVHGMTDEHHAYLQPENDNAPVIPVTVRGKVFKCHPWMISQAQEFMDLIRLYGHVIELDVKGPGLLAAILEAGAEAADEEIMTLA